SAQDAAGSATKADTAQQAAEQSAQDAAGSAIKADTAQSEKNAADSATEMDKRINLAASQVSKKTVKEVKGKNKRLDKKIEEKTKHVEKKIEDKANEIYKYAQNLDTKMGEYHVHSEKRFSALETEMRQSVRQLDSKINRVEKRANAGIASVAAMTNIPFSNANRFSVGVGLGQYNDGSAIAVGAQAKLTENVNVKASTSWNNAEGAVMGAGIAIGW
ncbi:YadA C-terminal domain-containing protein, partial [Xenorhabdus lircayensis]